ncbi:2-keto-3-deoxy-L-rhamnonate aldolase RhmA [Parasphingorhabdus marina DSM 22363]|uniref:2-keto-3-deoxy-L-rhamnonate aldolase RhmA n=1 Tax=Parasphingorhabdus marina DSM 22363 TaxID=1123272 RepID=A0A1N6D3A9_9SPHN|nr:aldolase/citrate lyase family protein [Parasphingorhabdus marina]SIN65281.1 2-keto-3-deoxy-L-rhamnonate aldolase RhmA [Parasphingorhabdus marina DSM 22363]
MNLKAKIAAGDPVLGSFLKTPSAMLVEVLARADLDCLCLDAEHAPFDRSQIDQCALAARAAGLPLVVRPQHSSADQILNALDCGATGLLLPHIRSGREASDAVRHGHYGPGGRGYAGSSRAAGYGAKDMQDILSTAADQTVLIAQIEDREALDDMDAIAATEGLDALFIGMMDLTVALDCDNYRDARVQDAVAHILKSAKEAGKPVGLFTPSLDDIPTYRGQGASLFLLGSDHAFMLSGARALTEKVRGLL